MSSCLEADSNIQFSPDSLCKGKEAHLELLEHTGWNKRDEIE